jgi:glutamate 5-kinase
MTEARKLGAEVILVSSGATALGMEQQNLSTRPDSASDIKALSAIGQGLLLGLWRNAFARYGVGVAQVLLTHSDLAHRDRILKIKSTLNCLLSWGVIPIINENDSVTTDEISLGDNDRLSAQVSKLVDSTQLLILSSVPGVLDETSSVIPELLSNSDAKKWVRTDQSATGRGGMASKLKSAFAAVAGGIDVTIASGRRERVIQDAIHGLAVGTRLPPVKTGSMSARQHWIAYTLRSRGRLHIDDGAVAALCHGGASLLPVGLTAVEGSFVALDAVSVVAPDGRIVASGLVTRDSTVLQLEVGKKGSPAIHRDNLVLNPSEREADNNECA